MKGKAGESTTHVQGRRHSFFSDNLKDSGYEDHDPESKPHVTTSWPSSCIERRLGQIKRSSAFLESSGAEKGRVVREKEWLSSLSSFRIEYPQFARKYYCEKESGIKKKKKKKALLSLQRVWLHTIS